MSRRNSQDLISTRRSRWYYVDGTDDELLQARLHSEPEGYGYYEHMLMEDVGHLLPYGRGIDEGFTANVTGAHAERAESLIRDALPTQYDRSSLAEALREFFSRTAQLLVLYGPPTYEIDYLLQPGTPDDTPVAFRLEPLQHGSIDRLHGKPIQYVPRSTADHVHKNGLGYVELGPDRLITFELPRSMARDVRRAVDFLVAASRQQRAEFALVERSMQERTDYDATLHHQSTGELLLEATRPIGWTARGLYKDHVLDPFAVWRQLRFKRFKTELRDSILEQLNAALASIGPTLGFEAQVQLSGVPTIGDLDAAEADLRDGRRSLRDLASFAV